MLWADDVYTGKALTDWFLEKCNGLNINTSAPDKISLQCAVDIGTCDVF